SSSATARRSPRAGLLRQDGCPRGGERRAAPKADAPCGMPMNDDLRNAMSRLLRASLEQIRRAHGGLVCTLDGRTVVSHALGQPLEFNRLAAITATVLSITGSAAREIGGQSCGEVLLSTDGGELSMQIINDRYGLLIIADSSCPQGILLSNARRLASQLRQLVDQMTDRRQEAAR
ncbi:MAG: roadblock/LC7 domain-containing protein, partial [Casimicrobiaceae bacterium]